MRIRKSKLYAIVDREGLQQDSHYSNGIEDRKSPNGYDSGNNGASKGTEYLESSCPDVISRSGSFKSIHANFEVTKGNGVEMRVQEFRRACQELSHKEFLMRQSPVETTSQEAVKKISIHIKLDEDIVTFFKKDGPGYQTRINSFLRKAFEKL